MPCLPLRLPGSAGLVSRGRRLGCFSTGRHEDGRPASSLPFCSQSLGADHVAALGSVSEGFFLLLSDVPLAGGH